MMPQRVGVKSLEDLKFYQAGELGSKRLIHVLARKLILQELCY